MATIPVTNFWEPEQTPTAANMNAFYRDNTKWLVGYTNAPLCRLALTSPLAVANNTLTFVPGANWTEVEDTDGMHASNSGLISINTDGLYEFYVHLDWAHNLSGSITTPYTWAANVGLNNPSGASTIIANTILEDSRWQTACSLNASGERVSYGFSELLTLHQGDYLELWVRQFTGATRNLRGNSIPVGNNPRKCASSTSMGLRWVGNL